MSDDRNAMTLIVFSNDFDRAMAAFILATGAAASGMRVTLFFTFWGLSLLRRDNPPAGRPKTIVERLFGWMLPLGPEKTVLSKLNFLGAGTAMMKNRMKKKHITQLTELMALAAKLDVKLVACTTSMEMMGIRREELVDACEIGGVATYLGHARDSAVNLFV